MSNRPSDNNIQYPLKYWISLFTGIADPRGDWENNSEKKSNQYLFVSEIIELRN